MTDNANEKVLFDLRVTDAGTQITTSAEWDAYHAQRFPRLPWAGHLARWAAWMRDHCGTEPSPPAETDLRATLNSLQSIYDDLYTAPAEG
ncbi:MAG: hypothetical protein K8S97_13105 [Anaerolineae bacterium]|nr:hypothetical protein [Anaerolineae bacterium]